MLASTEKGRDNCVGKLLGDYNCKE